MANSITRIGPSISRAFNSGREDGGGERTEEERGRRGREDGGGERTEEERGRRGREGEGEGEGEK